LKVDAVFQRGEGETHTTHSRSIVIMLGSALTKG